MENLPTEINTFKADSGYHNSDNLAKMAESQVVSLIDDPAKRRVDSDNFKYDKVNIKYDSETDTYICPEEKVLNLNSIKEEKSIYKCKDCPECSVKLECVKKIQI